MPRQPLPDEKSAVGPVPGIPAERSKVSCAEVAKLFLVSAEHVKRLCASGELAANPIAGRKPGSVNSWSIPVAALADFVRHRAIHGKNRPAATPKKRAGRKPA